MRRSWLHGEKIGGRKKEKGKIAIKRKWDMCYGPQSDKLWTSSFSKFFGLKKIKIKLLCWMLWGSLGMGLAFWKNGCTTLPFFEACPYTWEGEIFHHSWSLKISFFFQILFFLYLEYTWTSISIIGIFFSWITEFTKNSSRIGSVMETFCILPQFRVHLSMFHSSSTSKIWHMNT